MAAGKSMEAPKSTIMGPWIHREQILSVDQIDLNGGFSLALEQLPWISDVAGPLGGLSGTHVGRGGAAKWALDLLSHPLAPCVHVCHHFGIFLLYFLHTNNSYKHKWN
jgi:hypothetical protein